MEKEEKIKKLTEEINELLRMRISGRSSLASLNNREFDALSERLEEIDEKIKDKESELRLLTDQ